MSAKKKKKKAAKKKSRAPRKKPTQPTRTVPPDAPRWGPPVTVGNIGPRKVTIREPLNQTAIDSLSDDEALALVLAVLVGRLEDDAGESGRLSRALKGWAGTEALREKGGG